MKSLVRFVIAVGTMGMPAGAAIGIEYEIVSAPEDPAIHGVRGNDASYRCGLSTDLLVTAFESFAFQLVPDDTNGSRDVFVRDRSTGATERISLDAMGAEIESDAGDPALSGDGRLVAFTTAADLLGLGATESDQVYLFDRDSGLLTLVSRGLGGGPANGDSYGTVFSRDGSHIAFVSRASDLATTDVNELYDAFVYDIAADALSLVSVTAAGVQGDADVYAVDISADGNVVAFETASTTFDPGDTNGVRDVYAKHLPSGLLRRASVDSSGVGGAESSTLDDLSGDGLAVAFTTASALVAADNNGAPDVYLHRLVPATTARLSEPPGGGDANGESGSALLGDDANRVVFSSRATNLAVGTDGSIGRLFLRDIDAGTLELLPTGSEREAIPLALDPAATRLCFSTYGADLGGLDYNGSHDVYVLNLAIGTLDLVSRSESPLPTTVGNGASQHPAASADGNLVVFESSATDLEADPDALASKSRLYLRDMGAATVESVVAIPGGAADNLLRPDLSADGRFVVFESYANNLVPPDDAESDVFVMNRDAGTLIRISEAAAGGPGHGEDATISADGRRVAFVSRSDLLLDPADANGHDDVYLWDEGSIRRISVGADGGGADGDSRDPRLSDDGGWLLFESEAGNLTADVPPGGDNLFLADVETGTRHCLTCSSDLQIGFADLSGDATRVVFHAAPDGATVPPFGQPGVFVYERSTDRVVRLPIPLGENHLVEALRVSGDGSTVAASAVLLLRADSDVPGVAFAPRSSGDLRDSLLLRYRIDTGELHDALANAPGRPGPVQAIAIDHDGNRIVASLGGALLPALDRNRTGTPDVYAISYQPGTVAIDAPVQVDENAGTVTVSLTRSGGSDGRVHASLVSADGTAIAGQDYVALADEAEWADGEEGARVFVIDLIDDANGEPDERFDVRIDTLLGGAVSDAASTTITIVDDDVDDRVFADGFEDDDS